MPYSIKLRDSCWRNRYFICYTVSGKTEGIKALRKYKSDPARKEKVEKEKSLGEVLKKHRMDCSMTQEFVAQTLGVSRQAVSKWESGRSAPSTTNLMALAKLFGISPEDLLKEVQ